MLTSGSALAHSPHQQAPEEELGGVDPSRAPKFLLEYLKTWHLLIIVIVFTVAIVLAAGVGQLAPAPYTIESTPHQLSVPELDDFYKRNATVYHETKSLWGPNQDWWAAFRLTSPRNLDRSIGKDDLLVSVRVYYRESISDPWTDVVSDQYSQAFTHRLSCSQFAPLCNSISIAHEPNNRHNFYRIGITIFNAGDLYDEGYLGDITTAVIYTNALYSFFELGWRLLFLASNVIVAVFFLVLLFITRTKPSQMAVEQKLVLLLMAALILFNNPLFIFDVFLNWIYVFPLLNQIFIYTFVSVLLFHVLVLLHATILRKPGRRSFLSFYLPKIVWVSCIWLVNVGSQVWFHFQGMTDPTQPIMSSTDPLAMFTTQLSFLASVLLDLGYAFWVLYLLFRGFGKMSRQRLVNIDSRFKFVWLITFLTLAITIGFAVFSAFFRSNNAIVFVCYWTLFNIFVTFNAFVYAPTAGSYSPWEVQKNIQQAAAPASLPPPDSSNGTHPNPTMDDNYGVPHQEIDMTDMQQLRDDEEDIRFDDPKAPVEEMHEINITDEEQPRQ